MTAMVADAERDNSIIWWTRRGLTAVQIGERLNLSARQVQRERTRLGCQVHPKAPLLSDDEINRAKAMLDDGAPVSEVARTLRRSETCIGKRFPQYIWTREQVRQYNSDIQSARPRTKGFNW